ncbi:MAG: GNAT family N-acetyltransferase [Myxococcales bacterium FL481]|nr:MAG: GNAT family N-acetyltransferase [Myxococcales bacterium FL481]
MRHNTNLRIRAASASDLAAIEALAVAAKMFPKEQVGFLSEQFNAAARGAIEDACWLVMEREGAVVGAVNYAPEPYSDRLWNLYFIVVEPNSQGQGLGKMLMEHVENALRERGESDARVLIVETSSTRQYEGTRAFYAGLGYTKEAVVRQFYGPDDDKVVFWKSLVAGVR